MPHLSLPRAAALVLAAAITLAPATAVLTMPRAAFAQQADAFTVRNVPVDVSAANPVQAREQAFNEGQKLAYRKLMERLVAPADLARLPTPSTQQVVLLVRDVAVEQEKASAVRYIATLSVRFKPDAIRRLLRDAGVAYAETRNRPVVVLPVYKETAAGKAALFEPGNPWRAAWSQRSGGNLVNLVAPGDQPEFQSLDADSAVAGDAAKLAPLAQRYNTQDLLVAVATPDQGGLTVRLIPIGPTVPKTAWDSRQFAPQPGEDLPALMKRAADEVAAAVDDGYRKENTLKYDRAATLAAKVPLGGLNDWMTVRERLARAPVVRGYEIESISRSEANVVLHFVGDQQQLESVLAQHGLGLTWGDGRWVMQPSAMPATQPTAAGR